MGPRACGRHWAARRVRGRAAIANLATIGTDWDDAAAGLADHAGGWWSGGGRLDFRAAVENPERRYRAEARYEASCQFLAAERAPTVASMMRHLGDHYGGTIHHPGRKDGDPRASHAPRCSRNGREAALVAERPTDLDRLVAGMLERRAALIADLGSRRP